jgi:hypothetical protein
MECYVPTMQVAALAKAKQEPAPAVAEAKVVAPAKPEPERTPPPAAPAARTVEKIPPVQEKPVADIELHKNVYLFDTAPATEIPGDLAGQYRSFLSVFREALRKSTCDQTDENRLIMRVSAGMREVGPAKTRRAHARITSLVGNANKEYIVDFSLHSYTTNGPVSREETEQFLKEHILEPLECYAPAEKILASPKTAF